MNPLPIFALAEDLKEVLSAVEAAHTVSYALSGMFEEPVINTWPTVADIPGFGVATTGDTVNEPTYLLGNSNFSFQLREVPQRRGGIRYAVDTRGNPGAMGIHPGGHYLPGIVIAGQLGISPVPTDVDTLFLRILRQRFSKVRSYLVGPRAMDALLEGARLTVNHLASRIYDLRPEP